MISIDVGNRNLHIVEGNPGNQRVELTRCISVPIPQGMNDDGTFSRVEELSRILTATLSSNHMNSREAVMTVNISTMVTRDFEFPNAKPAELSAMVRSEMEQVLAAGASNHIIDYRVTAVLENNKKVKVRAAALPRDVVERALALLSASRLKPVALDIHANSVAKLFSEGVKVNGLTCSNDCAVLLAEFGYSGTSLYIISNSGIEFTRTIPLGGREFDSIISRNLGITPQEAEEIKLKADMGHLDALDHDTEDQVRTFINRWTDEIHKLIQYHNTRSALSTIRNMFLFGGGSRMAGLTEYLEGLFSIKCEVIKDVSKVKLPSRGAAFPIDQYINAIGAMIRL
ncbi:MAG TPA: hypothetical protein DD727_07610 [Clostridiales bacterium]|nr:hypothetical protein [Clostridiales bacterium]